MSNEKFSPGEWTAHLGIMEPTFIFIGKEEDYKDGETPVVCELHHGIKKIHPASLCLSFDVSEMQANARLIAAAPSMYKVLKRQCVACQLRDHEIECEYCEINKVLKKARGEE